MNDRPADYAPGSATMPADGTRIILDAAMAAKPCPSALPAFVAEQRLMRLVAAIHGDAGGEQILTEGQIAKIIQCDIVEVRRLCDEAPNRRIKP